MDINNKKTYASGIAKVGVSFWKGMVSLTDYEETIIKICLVDYELDPWRFVDVPVNYRVEDEVKKKEFVKYFGFVPKDGMNVWYVTEEIHNVKVDEYWKHTVKYVSFIYKTKEEADAKLNELDENRVVTKRIVESKPVDIFGIEKIKNSKNKEKEVIEKKKKDKNDIEIEIIDNKDEKLEKEKKIEKYKYKFISKIL